MRFVPGGEWRNAVRTREVGMRRDKVWACAGVLVVAGACALGGCGGQGAEEVEKRMSALGSYVACASDVLPVAAATASSVQQNHFLASWAVDGDPTTRWSSNVGMPQWLQLDMGARVFVRSLEITWQTAFSTAFR